MMQSTNLAASTTLFHQYYCPVIHRFRLGLDNLAYLEVKFADQGARGLGHALKMRIEIITDVLNSTCLRYV